MAESRQFDPSFRTIWDDLTDAAHAAMQEAYERGAHVARGGMHEDVGYAKSLALLELIRESQRDGVQVRR